MERVELTVRGDGAPNVPRAIQDVTGEDRTDYDGDGFAVVAVERFYYRSNSTLQTTVVFERVDDATCEVTLISGGGGAGLLKDDVGTEQASSKRLVQAIEDFCRVRDLEIQR